MTILKGSIESLRMYMCINNKKIIIFFSLLIFQISLELGYFYGVGVIYKYTGIVVHFDFAKQLISLIFIIFISAFSSFIILMDNLGFCNLILLVFSGIPTVALWGISDVVQWDAILATALYWIFMELACFLFQSLYYKKEKLRETKKNNAPIKIPYIKHLNLILLGCILFCTFFAFQYGSGIRWLSLNDSLNARLTLRNVKIPTALNYFFVILGGAALPCFFTYCLVIKKRFHAIAFFLCGYLLYSVNGMKTWLVLYIVILLFYIIQIRKWSVKKSVILFINGCSALWLCGLFIYKEGGNYFILSYLERVMTLLATLHYHYFDFFHSHEFLFLRESFMKFLFPAPFPERSTLMIGHIYYGSETMNCTNGMFSDAFANFGYFGVVLYPFILFFALTILSKLLDNKPPFLIFSVLFIFLLTLCNSSFFLWVISGGYAVIITFLFIKRKKYKQFFTHERN